MNSLYSGGCTLLLATLVGCSNPISLEQGRKNYTNDIKLSVESILKKNKEEGFSPIEGCPGGFYKKVTNSTGSVVEQVRSYTSMGFKYNNRYYLEKSNYIPGPIFAHPKNELYGTGHIVDTTQPIGIKSTSKPLTVFQVDQKPIVLACNMPTTPTEYDKEAQISLDLGNNLLTIK